MTTYIRPISEPLPEGALGKLIAESADEINSLLIAGEKHKGTYEDFVRQEAGRLFPAEWRPRDDDSELDIEALAIAVLVKNPSMSVTDIAKTLGCNRTSLYRKERFKTYLRAVQAAGEQSRNDLPRGQKDGETGDIEAWDSGSGR